MTQLLFLELNEINFPMVQHYAEVGALPSFHRLFREHGYSRTESESAYEHLEPWIQWVTAHTGRTLEQHGIFRLGDIVQDPQPQIWEQLEAAGLRVGAISPMNAANQTERAAFFIPDPWTNTRVSGSKLLEQAHGAIRQVVGDNAKQHVKIDSLFWLALFAMTQARPSRYMNYLRMVTTIRKKKWRKAMLLDRLLADSFITQTKRTGPDFATLFLNAGAHIQHHYLFSSSAYEGPLRNPEWHVSNGNDPVGEVYALYDQILGDIMNQFPQARIMVATGLHQDPNPELTYYWRLNDHAAFLCKHGVVFDSVDALMSRDFLIRFKNADQATHAEQVLESAKDAAGESLFQVDNRGDSIFVMLTYPSDIATNFSYTMGGREHHGLRDEVSFVAIKNGRHNGTGFFTDTGTTKASGATVFPLASMPERIHSALQ